MQEHKQPSQPTLRPHHTVLLEAIRRFIKEENEFIDKNRKDNGEVPPEPKFTDENMLAMQYVTAKMDLVDLISKIDSLVSSRRKMGSSGMQTAVLTNSLDLLEFKVEELKERGL